MRKFVARDQSQAARATLDPKIRFALTDHPNQRLSRRHLADPAFAPAGPPSVPFPEYAAAVFLGLHVSTGQRGVGGFGVDVLRCDPADFAWP